jgi:hypothetical protein
LVAFSRRPVTPPMAYRAPIYQVREKEPRVSGRVPESWK